ncbi:MAG: hypothetical protein ACYC6L_09120 [Anaerolineae bacterium]
MVFKRTAVWLLVPILLMGLLVSCQPVGSTPSGSTETAPTITPQDVSLIVLHTGDAIGYIDTCG